jgi:spermidine synthase
MVVAALPVIFFVSGCAALLFETLWFYQAGLTFGNTIWASSLVLAGFMGGLALGNALATRLRPGAFHAIRTYGMLEAAIGISGFALVVGLPPLTTLIGSVLEPVLASAWITNALRLTFAFLLLLIPSTAMGATLPVMVAALYRRDPRFGRVLGKLYGWNTLGAVVGALAGDLVLIDAVGVRGTGLIAAGISLSVASLALLLSRRFEGEDGVQETSKELQPLAPNARWLLVAAALAGFSLLGLEVAWFRFLLHFMFGSSQAFAVLLATVLTGIGTGGLLGGYLASSKGRAQRLLPGVAMLTGLVCLALYHFYPAGPRVHTLGATLMAGAPLMFPVAFLSGVLFTLLGDSLKQGDESETRAAGLLTLSNTTGAMLGPLLVGFVLLPNFGVDRCVQVLGSLYLITGLVALAGRARPEGRMGTAITSLLALALAATALTFPVGTTLDRHLEPIIEPYLAGGNLEVVATREGLTETIIYLEKRAFGEPLSYRMLTNGYSISSSNLIGQRYMKLFVYLPMALNPDAKSALLISYGVGNTAKALTDTAGLESIVVVDTSRDVLDLNRIVYPNEGENPLYDRRVQVHIEDGRYYLGTTTRRFDLITGEPPPPKMAGIVSLYTREYFALIYDRLSDGGIASYWLPAHLLSPNDSKSIIRAFCDVFEDCTLWGGAGFDWILLGTRDAVGPGTATRFASQWSDPVLGPDLKAIGVEKPEQLGALFMAGPRDLEEMTADVAPLIDNRPKRLSDDWFDLEAEVATYVSWLQIAGPRERFAKDPFITRMWPAEYLTATADYFDIQWEINLALIAIAGKSLETQLPKVHYLLSNTELTTLPLWILGSDADRQKAARNAIASGHDDVHHSWELARGALVERDYTRAAELFLRTSEGVRASPIVRTLSLYSRVMSIDLTRQHALIRSLEDPASTTRLEPWVVPFLKRSTCPQRWPCL